MTIGRLSHVCIESCMGSATYCMLFGVSSCRLLSSGSLRCTKSKPPYRYANDWKNKGPRLGKWYQFIVHNNVTLFWRVVKLPENPFFLAQQPPVGHGLLIHEVSRPHNDTTQSVGLLWTSDQFVAKPLPDNTQHSQQTDRRPCPRWDSNPRSQQANGRRPTP